jgi:hypothetical protein
VQVGAWTSPQLFLTFLLLTPATNAMKLKLR